MAAILYNNVTDTLGASAGASDTTLTVTDGSKFTDPGAGNYFPMYVIAGSGAHEIVHVTGVSGSDLTVIRAQEDTDPLTFAGGETVQIRATSQSLRELDASEMSVTTSTGDQTVPGAMDDRVNKGQVGSESVTTSFGTESVVSAIERSGGHGRIVSPLDFGAVDDPLIDQASEIQAAIDSGAPVVDGLGFTYRVDTALTLRSDLEFRNFKLDFSNAASGLTMLNASGVETAETALSSTGNQGDSALNVTDASLFSTGDLVYIYSTKAWESITSSTFSEIHVVRSVDTGANTVEIESNLHYGYGTGDGATLRRLDTVKNVKVENIIGTGSGAGGDHRAALFDVCSDFSFVGCQFDSFDTASVRISRSARFLVKDSRASKMFAAGLAYGVSIFNGCTWGKVESCFFESCRHGVTIGGTSGINRYIIIEGNTAHGCDDAGFDSHPASDYVVFNSNVSEQYNGQDGLVSQGANATISNNIIRGSTRYGILSQMSSSSTIWSVTITGNTISDSNSGSSAIYVLNQGSAIARNVSVTGNIVKDLWDTGIRISTSSTGAIEFFSITGNDLQRPTTRGIYIANSSTGTIFFGTITGNTVRVVNSENIYLNALSASDIQYVTVTGNTVFGGTYGIRGANTNRIAVVGNVTIGASSANISVAGADSVAANNVTT